MINNRENSKTYAYMDKAIKLAKKGSQKKIGTNPLVGCVVVKNNHIIATGYHQCSGQPHAEAIALSDDNIDYTGADLYVTLTPCCHFGKTPPCVDLIIKKGIKRVFIADEDINTTSVQYSIDKLTENNIQVFTGILKDKAHKLNKIYNYNQMHQKPYVTLKSAISINAKIYEQNNQYITSNKSRRLTQQHRKEFCAILVGVNTVNIDNPLLTYRLKDKQDWMQPIRVICDTHLSINLDSNIVKTAKEFPTIIATSSNIDKNKVNTLISAGVKIMYCKTKNNLIDLDKMLTSLYQDYSIASIYVEGGNKITTSLLEENLVQELYLFISNKFIAENNSVSICNLNNKLTQSFKLKNVAKIEDDIFAIYEVKE